LKLKTIPQIPDGKYVFDSEKMPGVFTMTIEIENRKFRTFFIKAPQMNFELKFDGQQKLISGDFIRDELSGKIVVEGSVALQQEFKNDILISSCEVDSKNTMVASGWCTFYKDGVPYRSIHYVADRSDPLSSVQDGVGGYAEFKWGDNLKKIKGKYGARLRSLGSFGDIHGGVDYRGAKFLEKTGMDAYVLSNFTTKPFKSLLALYFVDDKLIRTAHLLPSDVVDLYLSQIKKKYKFPFSTEVDLSESSVGGDSLGEEVINMMKVDRFSVDESYYNGTIYILKSINMIKGDNFWLVYEDENYKDILKESLKKKIKVF
jgi:hypothetical protein